MYTVEEQDINVCKKSSSNETLIFVFGVCVFLAFVPVIVVISKCSTVLVMIHISPFFVSLFSEILVTNYCLMIAFSVQKAGDSICSAYMSRRLSFAARLRPLSWNNLKPDTATPLCVTLFTIPLSVDYRPIPLR